MFCGIRDIRAEFSHLLENPDESTYSELYKDRRLNATLLKPVEALAGECEVAAERINNDVVKREMWRKLAAKSEALFPEIEGTLSDILTMFSDEIHKKFISLSTGYKYFLHSLTHLVAYIEENSLVLFDEPENHIHPPMLAFMLAIMRKVLAEYKSVMLVATHSPVVVQEIPAANVFVVSAQGGKVHFRHPLIETYGAGIGEITNEVFGLTTDKTEHFRVIDQLYAKWYNDWPWNDEKEMLRCFYEKLGGRLSTQLRVYLICKYYAEREG